MENHTTKCLICEESCPQKGLAFFKFPKDESRLKMWIKEISPVLDSLEVTPSFLRDNGRICARHFKEKDFINFKKNSLVYSACPNIGITDLNLDLLKEEKLTDADFINEHNIQDEDTFQCGRCKTQFQLLSEFIDHKRSQCELNKTTEETTEKNVEENSLPLENTFLISFENKVSESSSLMEDSKPHEIVKIVQEESPTENEIVSFVMSDNGFLIGNPIDISSLAGQVIINPKLQTNGRHLLMNNSENNGSVGGLILTTDSANNSECGEIIFTCPVSNDPLNNRIVIPSEVPNEESMNKVVFTADTSHKSSQNSITETSVNFCEVNNGVDASQLELITPNLLGFVYGQLPMENPEETSESPETKEENELGRNKTKLPCSYCGKVFEKPFNLQQHKRVHTGERPFQCIICGRAFSQKSNVRKHMMRHKVWPQAKQTLKINMDQNLQSGSQDVLDQMNYSCQYCSLSFKSYSLHKKHLAVHSNYKVYRCIQKDCDETFNDLDEFLTHSKLHSSAEFQCHICLKAFTSLEELGAHQYDHDTTSREKKDIEVKLKCEVCHAQFKTVESLKNHLAVDTHNYECPHCKSIFSSERFLRRHLATHIDPSQSKFKCQYCKKTFRTQKYLNNHLFIHLKEKPFNCEHCDKQFASKYRLKRHLAIHLSQYFECPFKTFLGCDKTFYRKDKLRDHVTTHSHCRLRSCQVCSKTYTSLSKLNQHVKRDHKISKSKQILKCTNCSQTFRKQKQLLQHHCTVGEKKFRSRLRNSVSNSGSGKINSETVSNIEIIMVPYVSESRTSEDDDNMT